MHPMEQWKLALHISDCELNEIRGETTTARRNFRLLNESKPKQFYSRYRYLCRYCNIALIALVELVSRIITLL